MLTPNLPIPRLATLCDLGYALSLGVLGRARQAKVDSVLQNATHDAKALGLTLPPLPPLTGKDADDLASAIHYLLHDLTAVVKALEGEKEILVLEVGMKSNLMRAVYVSGDDNDLAKILSDRCRRSGLTGTTCEELRQAVDRKAPIDEIGSLLEKLEQDLRAFCAN